MKEENFLSIIRSHHSRRGGLISILEDMQTKYGYLPEQALRTVAQETGFSLVDIYGVATFYKLFSLEPKGKHIISVCSGTACHVRGSSGIVEEFEEKLQIEAAETTPDGEITLATVNCLGACALGPIVVADGHYFSNVKRRMVGKIIDTTRAGIDRVDIATDERIFPIEACCPHCNRSLIDKSFYIDGYPSIRATISFERKHGWIRLSCLYGSYSVEQEYDVPADTIANFFCPHCHAELNGSFECTSCGAPMVSVFIRGGGVLHICSCRGCKGHMLDLHGASL